MPETHVTTTARRARVEKTRYPSIYRDHKDACPGGERCECPWMVQVGYKDASGRRRQVKKRFLTLAEARRWKGSFTTGERKATPRKYFDTYARAWVAGYTGRGRGIRERTRETYRRDLEARAIPYFGHVPLTAITNERCQAFVSEMHAELLAPATVERYWAVVRTMLKAAHRAKLIGEDVTAGVYVNRKAPRRREDTRDKILTVAQLLTVLDSVEAGTQDRLLVEVLSWSALRIGEALALLPEDVTFGERPSVRVRGQWTLDGEWVPWAKSERGLRTIPIDEELARRLWEAVADKPADEFIFLNPDTGKPWDRSTVGRIVAKAGRRAGVKISAHCLRHSRITHLLQAGNRARDVADYAGDREETIIAVYSHAIPDTRLRLPGRGESVTALA